MEPTLTTTLTLPGLSWAIPAHVGYVLSPVHFSPTLDPNMPRLPSGFMLNLRADGTCHLCEFHARDVALPPRIIAEVDYNDDLSARPTKAYAARMPKLEYNSHNRSLELLRKWNRSLSLQRVQDLCFTAKVASILVDLSMRVVSRWYHSIDDQRFAIMPDDIYELLLVFRRLAHEMFPNASLLNDDQAGQLARRLKSDGVKYNNLDPAVIAAASVARSAAAVKDYVAPPRPSVQDQSHAAAAVDKADADFQRMMDAVYDEME